MNIHRLVKIIKKNITLKDVYILIVSFTLGVVTSLVIMPSDFSSHSNMSNSMYDMSQSLKGRSGQDLDKKFLQEMIVHHQGALDMSNIIISSDTNNLKLKNFASKIIKVQEREIEEMTNWLEEYK